MIASRIGVVLIGLNAAGCISPAEVDLPTFAAPGVASLFLIVAVEPPNVSSLYAVDIADPQLPPAFFSLGRDAEVYALANSSSLLQLTLEPGEVELPLEGAPSRPLPTPLARVRYDRAHHGWQDESPDLSDLQKIRLPPDDPNFCYAAGQCSTEGLCLDTCPAIGELRSPEPPRAPHPLQWTCPPGWKAFGDQGEVGCADRGKTCGPGLVQLPGDDRCRPIGAACPSPGTFGADPGHGRRTIYVRAGASGDGSEREPLGDLASALSLVSFGEAVAVVGNIVDDRVFRVPAGARLSGACARNTRLEVRKLELEDGAELEDLAVIGGVDVLGAATVRSVRINATGLKAGLEVALGGRILARRLAIGGPTDGIVLHRATADLEQVEIHDVARGVVAESSEWTTRDLRVDRAWLYALDSGWSRFAGQRIGIHDSGAIAVLVVGGSAELSELSIEDGLGAGVAAFSAEQLTLDRLYVARSGESSVYAAGPSRIALNDVRFETEGTLRRGRGGLSLGGGAVDARIERVVAIGTEDLVIVGGEEDHLVVNDLVARDGVGREGAVGCFKCDDFELERAVIANGPGYGVSTYLALKSRLVDVEIRDRRRILDENGVPIPERFADGIGGHSTRPLVLDRIKIQRVDGVAINIRDTDLIASDVDVDGANLGCEIAGSATVDLDRVRITRIEKGGIEFRGIALAVRDVEIRGTRLHVEGARGFAIRSDLPVRPISVRRLLIEDAGDVGLYVEPQGDLVSFAELSADAGFTDGAIVRGHPLGLGVINGARSLNRLLREIDLRGNEVAVAEILP